MPVPARSAARMGAANRRAEVAMRVSEEHASPRARRATFVALSDSGMEHAAVAMRARRAWTAVVSRSAPATMSAVLETAAMQASVRPASGGRAFPFAIQVRVRCAPVAHAWRRVPWRIATGLAFAMRRHALMESKTASKPTSIVAVPTVRRAPTGWNALRTETARVAAASTGDVALPATRPPRRVEATAAVLTSNAVGKPSVVTARVAATYAAHLASRVSLIRCVVETSTSAMVRAVTSTNRVSMMFVFQRCKLPAC